LLSVNGVSCDTTAPEVTLTADRSFVTADGAVTLSATTEDNLIVKKVIFEKDGEVIGVDTDAPFTFDADITGADNGLRIFSAKAVDIAGNEASASDRVVVAIGNRFFGTATEGENTYAHLLEYFDQITPGNAGKWGVVEAARDQMNWTQLDLAYNFAKNAGLPFKYHTLIWGSQAPSWLAALSHEEQLEELEEFMAAMADRYPNIDMIDVVNEPLHMLSGGRPGLSGSRIRAATARGNRRRHHHRGRNV
jgi:endo-1,4-beta-xylanase